MFVSSKEPVSVLVTRGRGNVCRRQSWRGFHVQRVRRKLLEKREHPTPAAELLARWHGSVCQSQKWDGHLLHGKSTERGHMNRPPPHPTRAVTHPSTVHFPLLVPQPFHSFCSHEHWLATSDLGWLKYATIFWMLHNHCSRNGVTKYLRVNHETHPLNTHF
jgi:hypothetical protein